MEGKKKENRPFSKLKSFYLSCRRHLPCSNSSWSNKNLPIEPIRFSKKLPIPSNSGEFKSLKMGPPITSRHYERASPILHSSQGDRRNETFEVQWRQVNKLEKGLIELEERLQDELMRLRSHLDSNNNNNHYICANGNNEFEGEWAKYKLERLDGDGGYLYTLFDTKEITYGVCQDLAIQFSTPALVQLEDGSNISEVLDQMAKMGRKNLITWLQDSMPITDISMDKPQGQALTQCISPKDFQEAILLVVIPKLRELVQEGLLIQMGVKEVVKRRRQRQQQQKIGEIRGRRQMIGDGGGDGDEMVDIMVMIIQARDPIKGYQAINEMMIGFVEAAHEKEEEGFIIKAVHVAGLMARRRNGQLIHNCLWCLSLPI